MQAVLFVKRESWTLREQNFRCESQARRFSELVWRSALTLCNLLGSYRYDIIIIIIII